VGRFGHVKGMQGTEMHRMVTRRNTKEEETKEGWIDGIRCSVTSHRLTEDDTWEKDMRRNLVLGKGKPLYSGQSLVKCKTAEQI
jgi:hypothetical protein